MAKAKSADGMVDVEFHIVGKSPLMLHNAQLANPLNEITKDIKKLTGKRGKTEADYEEIARLEHLGGLYLDEENRVVVPGINIEAMLLRAGKRHKLGDSVKCGLWSDGLWPVIYKGPKDPEELFKDKRFVDNRFVIVNKKRIMRCRPVFKEWALKFTVTFNAEVFNHSQVCDLVDYAGRLIGLCEMAPRHGRFATASEAKAAA